MFDWWSVWVLWNTINIFARSTDDHLRRHNWPPPEAVCCYGYWAAAFSVRSFFALINDITSNVEKRGKLLLGRAALIGIYRAS